MHAIRIDSGASEKLPGQAMLKASEIPETPMVLPSRSFEDRSGEFFETQSTVVAAVVRIHAGTGNDRERHRRGSPHWQLRSMARQLYPRHRR